MWLDRYITHMQLLADVFFLAYNSDDSDEGYPMYGIFGWSLCICPNSGPAGRHLICKMFHKGPDLNLVLTYWNFECVVRNKKPQAFLRHTGLCSILLTQEVFAVLGLDSNALLAAFLEAWWSMPVCVYMGYHLLGVLTLLLKPGLRPFLPKRSSSFWRRSMNRRRLKWQTI